jgi:hypothetical protein
MTVNVPPASGTAIPSVPPSVTAPHMLPVTYQSQLRQSNWCWAPCCVMVASAFNAVDPDLRVPPTMCHLAEVLLAITCCSSPVPASCDKGAWPDPAYQHLHINSNPDVPSPPTASTTVLTPDQIRQELRNGRPVEVLYQWTTGNSHLALIVGWYDDGAFQVYDPYSGIIWYELVPENWTGG